MDWCGRFSHASGTDRPFFPSLEFGSLQQLIYTELARNVAESNDEANVVATVELVRTNVEVRSEKPKDEEVEEVSSEPERIFMVRRVPLLCRAVIKCGVACLEGQLSHWICTTCNESTYFACGRFLSCPSGHPQRHP